MERARGRPPFYNMYDAPYIRPSSSYTSSYTPSYTNSSSAPTFYNRPVEAPKTVISQPEFQKLKKRRGDGPEMELRLLVRGRNAGAIIGRAGSNIKRVKQTFGVNLFLTDCQSPERILSIMGYFGSICEAILDMIPLIDNNRSSEANDDTDIRILMHTSFTGYVIGKKGHGIHDLEARFNTKIQVFHECCPRSTDRVVQINGRPVDAVNCITAIVELVIVHAPVGLILPYNPNNFIEIQAVEYGGFTSYDVTVPFQGGTVKHVPHSSDSNLSKDRENFVASQSKPHTATGPNASYSSASGHSGPESKMPSSSSNHGPSFPSDYRNPNSSGVSCPDPWSTMGEAAAGGAPWSQNSFYQGWTPETNPSADRCGWDQNPTAQGRYFSQGPGYGGEPSRNPQPHEGQGIGGDTAYGHQTGQASTSESPGNFYRVPRNERRRARPLDEGLGLGFFPVDSRTVQVSIPKALQTVVMGRRGAAIRDIRLESKAKIVIEVPPAGASERYLTLIGTPEQLQKAQYLLQRRYLEGKQHFTDDPEGFMNRGIRKRDRPDAPWMTEEIVAMKVVRRKLERAWRAAQNDETKKAFRNYSSEMNKVIRKVKEEYYKIHGGAPPENKRKRKSDKEGNKTADDKDKGDGENSSQPDREHSDNSQSSEEECQEECNEVIKTEQEGEYQEDQNAEVRM